MTDGGSFEGYTIQPIGPIKAGAVWYRALAVYLSPTSDFRHAYQALAQSAQDLVGTYPNDPRTGAPSDDVFTEDDADQVVSALAAVGMHLPGRCGYYEVLNPLFSTPCWYPDMIFEDDFENGINGWVAENSHPLTPYDWVQVTDLPRER